MQVQVKWNGKEYTRMRCVAGGEKVDVKPGDVLEMDHSMAEPLCAAYPDAEIIGMAKDAEKKLATNEVKPKDLKK